MSWSTWDMASVMARAVRAAIVPLLEFLDKQIEAEQADLNRWIKAKDDMINGGFEPSNGMKADIEQDKETIRKLRAWRDKMQEAFAACVFVERGDG